MQKYTNTGKPRESNFSPKKNYEIFPTLKQNSIQNAQKINLKLVKRVEVGSVFLIYLNLYVIIYAVEKRETVLRC